MAKVIAFSGNSSTGKTSLSFFATYYLKNKGYKVGYVKDNMRENQIDLDKFGSVKGEKCLLFQRLKKEYTHMLRDDIDFLVADLSLLDILAYLSLWADREGKDISEVESLVASEVRKYDLIFYLKTEGAEFNGDGYRIKKLRESVEPYYKEMIKKHGDYVDIEEIEGENLEERKTEIARVLDKLEIKD